MLLPLVAVWYGRQKRSMADQSKGYTGLPLSRQYEIPWLFQTKIKLYRESETTEGGLGACSPGKFSKLGSSTWLKMNFRQQKFPDFFLTFGILSRIPWLFRQIPWLSEVSFKFHDFSRFSRSVATLDTGQTLARSIYLKFAGPTLRITHHLPSSFLSDEYSAPLQGDHIFEKLNSLTFPWDFQGIFKLSPEKHEREKFSGIHFHRQLCDISYIFHELSRFFRKNKRFPWIFPEILTIFQIPWVFQVFHVFQVCGHPASEKKSKPKPVVCTVHRLFNF